METTHESSKQTLCSAQPAKPYAFSRKVFCEGMRDGVPIALGYFAVSFSLGIAARTAGFTPLQGFVASLLNNASAGEYAAFALIASGATYLEVAIITLIANARYLLMSCALAQRFAPGTPFFHRLIIGYDVTDELFGITIARPGYLNPFYTYGAIALAAPAWASGTALGIIAGNLLLNFLTVPDFIAYNYLTAPRTRTLSLIRKVWHAPCVAWTVRDESKEPLALARFDAVIFERYRPATYITPPIA